MEIKVLNDKQILIKHNKKDFIIKKAFIGGTLIENYFVFLNLYENKLEDFINNEETQYYEFESCDLLETLKTIQEYE